VGIRWKNVNDSKQNTAKLPADLLKCQCSLGSLEAELRTGPAAQAVGREPADPGCVPGPATNPACDAGKPFSPKFPRTDSMPTLAGTSREMACAQTPGIPHGVKPQALTSHPRRRHALGLSFTTDAKGQKPRKQPKML